MKAIQEFNLNESVYVKLNQSGIQILMERHIELYDRLGIEEPEFEEPKRDQDGYSEFQLYNLMHIFGEYLHIGNPNPPFDLNILFKK